MRKRRGRHGGSPATGPTFHGGRNVLDTVARLARRAKQRIAAVAYVSDVSRFPFKAGDVLVVDMSRRALGQGNTNPWKLARLHRKGVHLFNRPALHAKAFVFGNYVAVGSANLSATSRANDEAVLSVRGDERLRREILHKILEWADPGRRITPGFIEDSKEYYKPPKGGRGQPRRASRPPPQPIWLLGVDASAPPKGLRAQISEAESQVHARIAKPLEYKPRTARGLARDSFFRSARKGDWVVEIYRPRRGATQVCPPARLAWKEAVPNPRLVRGEKYIYTLEVRRDQRPVSLESFRRKMKQVGVSGDFHSKRVRSRRGVDAIWRFWPEEALRQRDGRGR